MNQSKQERLLQMGVRTVTGTAREGFFIPYRHAADIPEQTQVYEALVPLFHSGRSAFEAVLAQIEALGDNLRAIDGTGSEHARWDQYWYPRLDAASAYAMVRSKQPSHIMEIGSGHSTRFMYRAAQDGELACGFTAIDPAPRANIASLNIDIHRKTLQKIDLSLFSKLKSGDFLCVDSSHILMPGSDVDIVINRILPSLASGVFVAFHDIFLPFGYPADWAWRNYNEQNGVGVLLQGGYELVFASHYVVKEMQSLWTGSVINELGLLEGAHECGVWLRKL
ncbi:MAG: class I SAM-dependent methyltransferase [Rhizobiales bacterium]|nr:class I SAM-dependent methyltransferase [Hyphomicrobiales bacterium]